VLLAHWACPLRFLDFLRNYVTSGHENGLETSLFQPSYWMYFYSNPGSSGGRPEDPTLGVPVVLRSAPFGTCLSVGEGRLLHASAEEAGDRRQEFVRVVNDDGTTSILSFEGLYLSVGSDGSIHASATSKGPSERFDMTDLGVWSISLFSIELNRYVVAALDGSVQANGQGGKLEFSKFTVEITQRSGSIGVDHGHASASGDLHVGKLELSFARQERHMLSEHCPELLPERLARSFAFFRNSMEMSLVGVQRDMLDQPEFDSLIRDVAHLTFPFVLPRIATLRSIEKTTAATRVYETCQRFATALARNLEMKILWHDSGRFLALSEATNNNWCV